MSTDYYNRGALMSTPLPPVHASLRGGVRVEVTHGGNRVVEVIPDTARKLHALPGPVDTTGGYTATRARAVEQAREALVQRDEVQP